MTQLDSVADNTPLETDSKNLRFACSTFISVCSWEQNLSGVWEAKVGIKFNYNALATETSVNHMGRSEAGVVLQSCPNWGERDGIIRRHTGQLSDIGPYPITVGSITLGVTDSFFQGNSWRGIRLWNSSHPFEELGEGVLGPKGRYRLCTMAFSTES